MAEAQAIALRSGYEDEFVNAVDEDFHCSICHLPLKEAVQTGKCGHRFCRQCLDEHFRRLELRRESLNCPVDRNILLRDKDIFRDKATDRKILSFIIKCPREGCQWTGELRSKTSHQANCKKVLLNCSQHCGAVIAREEVSDHVKNTCPLTEVPCPYNWMGCTFKVQRQVLESHLQCETGHHLNLSCCKLNGTQDEVRKLQTEVRELRERENIRHNEIEERDQARQNHLEERAQAIENRFEERVNVLTDINHKLKGDLNTSRIALFFCSAVLIVITAVLLGRLEAKLEEQINGVQNKLTRKVGEVEKILEFKVTDVRGQLMKDMNEVKKSLEVKMEDLEAREFAGNADQDTVVYHELSHAIRARYIRIRPTAWHGHISMRVEVYGCKVCQDALGMESGAISNGQVRAFTEWDANHAAFQARLNFIAVHGKAGSWSAKHNSLAQWLLIDLGNKHIKVTGLATQGRNDYHQWVTKYKVQYSDDGVNFQYYTEQGQVGSKEFVGNADKDTVVYHELSHAIRARYIRFLPTAWHGHISMRVEVYGCKVCQDALGMESGAILNGQVRASTEWDANHAVFQARLHFKAVHGKAGSWSARHNNLGQWLQIDLGNKHIKVTGLATQGRNGYGQWVTKYKVQYSDDGVNFQYYTEQGQVGIKTMVIP